jgi:hypothetical protein
LKSSLTIDAASAGGKVSSVQIDAITVSERVIPMNVLVLILCEERTGPRSPDIATSLSEKNFTAGANDEL